MAETGPGSYRVRIAGQEILVPDLETLTRLARGGQIGGSAEVRPPGQTAWLPLAEVIGAGPRRDPWSAWDEADHVDPQSIWKEFAAPAEEEPTSPIVPLRPEPREGPTGPVRASSPDLDADELPTPAPSQPRPVARRPAGKVIAFPTRPGAPARPTRSEGATALAEPVQLRVPTLPRREEADEEPPSNPYEVRWGRLVAVGLLATVAMLVVVVYVTGYSTINYPRRGEIPTSSAMKPAAPAPQQPAVAAPVAPAAPTPPATLPDATTPAAALTEVAVYDQMEAGLRNQLSADVQEVSPSHPLEDALLIELQRMRLEVVRVHAPVVTWAGRKGDVPQAAEIHLTVRTSQVDFDRDVGAVALVTGKYIQRYSLDVPSFDVSFEGLGTTPLTLAVEGERARQFYLERKTLLQFLTKK